VIISEREQFIFIHNPKCAGTSVRNALRGFDTTGEFFWMYDTWNDKKIDKAHMPLFVLRNKYPQYFSLFDKYFVFMFVRNPYTRFVSAFNELHLDAYKTFRESGDVDGYKNLLNSFVMSLEAASLLALDYKTLRFARQLDLAFLDKKCYVDLILKIEDWPSCLSKIGVFNKSVQEKLMTSKKENSKPMRNSYKDLLDANSIKRITDLYHDDFELFGYTINDV
jgi:hypothetical protein